MSDTNDILDMAGLRECDDRQFAKRILSDHWHMSEEHCIEVIVARLAAARRERVAPNLRRAYEDGRNDRKHLARF